MATKKASGKRQMSIKSRPKPSSPRAGYRSDGVRYEKGGKVKKKSS